MSRNRTVLAALLGVLALSMLYAYFTMPRQEKAPPREAPRQTVKRPDVTVAEKTSTGNEDRIDFAYLDQPSENYPGAERDIFNFGGKRSKVQPKPETRKPVEVKPPVTETVRMQPPPMDAVNRSLSQFTFVGFLEKGGEKTIFLSSSGEMFLVKSGEKFGVNQEFLVKEIDGEFIRIKHAAREGIIELKLIEQERLNSAVSAPARLTPLPAVETQPRARFIPPNRTLPRQVGAPEEILPEMNQENNPETEEIPETEQIPETNEGEQRPEGEFNGKNQ